MLLFFSNWNKYDYVLEVLQVTANNPKWLQVLGTMKNTYMYGHQKLSAIKCAILWRCWLVIPNNIASNLIFFLLWWYFIYYLISLVVHSSIKFLKKKKRYRNMFYFSPLFKQQLPIWRYRWLCAMSFPLKLFKKLSIPSCWFLITLKLQIS